MPKNSPIAAKIDWTLLDTMGEAYIQLILSYTSSGTQYLRFPSAPGHFLSVSSSSVLSSLYGPLFVGKALLIGQALFVRAFLLIGVLIVGKYPSRALPPHRSRYRREILLVQEVAVVSFSRVSANSVMLPFSNYWDDHRDNNGYKRNHATVSR